MCAKKVTLLIHLIAIINIIYIGSSVAADGTITFGGSISSSTCAIDVNGQGTNATISLPSLPVSEFSGPYSSVQSMPFSLSLTGCSRSTLNTAYTFFESIFTDLQGQGRLINISAGGAAENVQLQINRATNGSMVVVGNQANQSHSADPIDISSGSGVLSYNTLFYATGEVTPGEFYTVTDYTIIYL